jgi:large subunit ribosomal protein L30
MEQKKIKVTLVRSLSGRLDRHKACARGLGLRRLNSSALVIDTPENRGMIHAIGYLLHVEEPGHET